MVAAALCSFDIVCEVDLQEVDNAVNQANREIQLRYDFKKSNSSFQFIREEKKICLVAADIMKLKSMQDVLRLKIVKRSLSTKILEFREEKKAFGESLLQEVLIRSGIEKDEAKQILKDIKAMKFNIQVAIQGDRLRVTGKNIDDLQLVIATLRESDYPFPVQFNNFRR